MALTIDTLLRFRAPPDWRGSELPTGLCFAPEVEWRAVNDVAEHLRLSLCVGLLGIPEGTSATIFVDRKMKSHLPSGSAVELSASIGGLAARSFSWTDGVAEVLSYFVELTPRLVAFIELAEGPPGMRSPSELALLAGELLARFAWADDTEAVLAREGARPDLPPHARCFEVWRQDDNGNRFVISGGHTIEEANRVLRKFEELSHKQTYWIVLANEAGG